MKAHVDPSLPPVDLTTLTCPECGQTLAAIKGDCGLLPTNHDGVLQPLCAATGDDLVTVIFRAQRAAAGLGIPRLVEA